MAQDNRFLTTGEFASRAGIQASKVSRLIRKGKIEAKKVRQMDDSPESASSKS